MNTRANALMILAMLTGLAACGPDGGGVPVTVKITPDAGGSVPAEVSPKPTAATPFLGTWTYASGSYSFACAGHPPQSVRAAGSVTFTYGAAPDELVASDGMGCDVPCIVSGNVCTAGSGHVCPGDLTVESLVYTLNNGMLREQSHGSAPIDGESCDITDDAVLTRG